MKDEQPFIIGSSEPNEHIAQHMEADFSANSMARNQRWLDYLVDIGFIRIEAIKLLNMRTHLYENLEVRERMANDSRIQFARWLYEHGEINDD